jgi:hypothetical protein
LEQKPFALLGVNVVGHEPEKLKEVMEKEQVTWRSISSRAVTSRWNAGTPTYYVIDVEGVIRYKWVGSPGEIAIEMALEKLIHQAEEDAKKKFLAASQPKIES